MSVTHPDEGLILTRPSDLAARHPPLAPMLVAACIFVMSAVVVLVFSGLPG